MLKLSIAVRMAGPLVGLAVGLQTVAQLVEQVGHYLVADGDQAKAEAMPLSYRAFPLARGTTATAYGAKLHSRLGSGFAAKGGRRARSTASAAFSRSAC